MVLKSEILNGKFKGETSKLELLGDFTPIGTGSVSKVVESVSGKPHFSWKFDAPVSFPDMFDDINAAVAGGIEYRGNRYSNRLEGDRGADKIYGNGGQDTIKGFGGNDRLFGGNGDDTIKGGNGADLLEGGNGSNTLFGGNGADVLDGRTKGDGRAMMYGGAGNDIYLENGGGRKDGNFDVRIGEEKGAGYDIVKSYSWDFTLPKHVEELRMMRSRSHADGNSQDNVIHDTKGRDYIKGWNGDDTLLGHKGDDYLWGGHGADVLKGGAGDDTLYGLSGKDILFGGTGDDILSGDQGKDRLSGGDGADRFIFGDQSETRAGKARDVITDFEAGQEVIDLRYVDADVTQDNKHETFVFIGDSRFSGVAGELRYKNGVVSGDTDGDARADFQIEIENGALLTEDDFIL
jgi:serralysin